MSSRAQAVAVVVAAVVVAVVIGAWALVVEPGQKQAVRAKAIAAATATPVPSVTSAAPIRLAAVGDSITEGNSNDFTGGDVGSLSWVKYAATDGVVFAGGWADGGAQSARMAASVKPVKADVLVILAGTNDYPNGVPFATTTANLEKIAATVGAGKVVVSSVPPRNANPGLAVEYNRSLESFARSKGWGWVDAAAALRDGQQYKDGLTSDGVHPTQAGAQIIGQAIHAAIS